ncbi:hypothetical protein SAY87_010356 [Trapa incisa]|uniref:O-methyltransferase C-terminal domain-containing protein n=1 Tax=Trapa incisa TaxID=236973 RepID=A0AAN7GU07_9MYRT|nr:hypothetical protein SAY87_010356 [Trapa incisa]
MDVTQHMVTNKDEDPKETSVASLVIFGAENVLFERMSMLKDAILYPENSPFFISERADLFDVSSKNPILNKSFNENIVRAYLHIREINFDLPHVIFEASLHERVEHMAGNMFDSLPKAETIWMKAILHDWDDKMCNKILRNYYNALPEEGKLLVMEILAPENSNNDEDLSENAVMMRQGQLYSNGRKGVITFRVVYYSTHTRILFRDLREKTNQWELNRNCPTFFLLSQATAKVEI